MPEIDDWITPGAANAPAPSPAGAAVDDWVTPPAGEVPAHKFGIMDTWPVRLAKSIYGAVTLPGDVVKYGMEPTHQAGVDPLSQEAIQRSADLAAIFNPAEPGITAGRGAFGAIKTPVAPKPLPESVAAAKTSVDLGAGLPAGIASPNPVVRATAQGARQLPFVGPKITEGVGKTIEAAGERVGDISSELAQGITDRAATGSMLKPALQDIIERNNGAMSDEYNAVRGMIDPQKEFSLPNTEAALRNVVSARQAARKTDTLAGLGDVKNLADQGASFEGLQRARSDFGAKTPFGAPNPGYTEGERKFLYGAMSRDMENVVRQQGGEGAVDALRQAHGNASKYIEQNKMLGRLANMPPEAIAAKVINAGREKTGDVGLLAQLRSAMPKEDFEQIGGAALSELGHNPATGDFSLAKFMTEWSKMSDRAKSILFNPGHKQALDEIANLGKFLKGGEAYKNVSNTGHAVGLFAVLEHLGEVAGEAATGNFKPALKAAAGATGGLLIGKLLARPATASSIARWTRAVQGYGRAPSIRNRVIVNIAARNLVNNLADSGIPREALKALSPQAAEPDRNQPPANGGSAAQRLQIRIPAEQNR